ncbi:hypothetical protein C7450_11293 [Chelatococcus asaccharovorans]|uniref:Uncharacterized protein n=1 Tax=Chelatococcus asaccharovorans TaxID=28210 RepID=A0A2V3TXZ2_9HYPH|nr:hypothetical protein C7450_11293 [Chelatococcus asaccharovorans]
MLQWKAGFPNLHKLSAKYVNPYFGLDAPPH